MTQVRAAPSAVRRFCSIDIVFDANSSRPSTSMEGSCQLPAKHERHRKYYNKIATNE